MDGELQISLRRPNGQMLANGSFGDSIWAKWTRCLFFFCVCVCVTRFATAIFWLLALGCFRNRRSNLLINGTLVGGTMQTPYCYSPSYWSLSSWVVAITGFGWRSAILPDFGVRLILPKFKLRDNIPERYQIVIELERDRDRTRQRPI